MIRDEAQALRLVETAAREVDPGAIVFVGAREFPRAQQAGDVTIVVQSAPNNHELVKALVLWCANTDGFDLHKTQVVQMGEVPVDLIEIEAAVYYPDN